MKALAEAELEFPGVAPGGQTDRAGYQSRFDAISEVKNTLLNRLGEDPRYGEDPIFSAFLRKHDEPGRAWNMAEWNERREG